MSRNRKAESKADRYGKRESGSTEETESSCSEEDKGDGLRQFCLSKQVRCCRDGRTRRKEKRELNSTQNKKIKLVLRFYSFYLQKAACLVRPLHRRKKKTNFPENKIKKDKGECFFNLFEKVRSLRDFLVSSSHLKRKMKTRSLSVVTFFLLFAGKLQKAKERKNGEKR